MPNLGTNWGHGCGCVELVSLVQDTPPAYDFRGASVASIEKRSGRFRIVFRFDGQKYPHAMNTDDFAEAEGCRIRLEENLRLLERGRLELPPEVDLPVFLLSDGMLNS